MKQHRWSGWPGCFCLDCGAEHAFENAMALGWGDADEDGEWHWDTEEHRKMVEDCDSECKAKAKCD